ncbi:hypothetical protein [Kineococcus sp. SYSU DK005]|uniref:hypothetical protein n=1 Tax=Kineococcus sp. SYSU DK005 TaxID=3383126 RepID=UPI003D7CE457
MPEQDPVQARPLEVPAHATVSGPATGTGTGAGALVALVAGQLAALPAPTRRALLLAAAGASSPAPELLAAARRLGLSTDDLRPAAAGGLVRVEHGRVRFRHALVVTALEREAAAAELVAVHTALADACTDAARAAWHRAAALAGRGDGPDDAVADALEAVALREARRGARAEAVTALRRAAALSGHDGSRARRLARAAEHAREGGLTGQAVQALREGFRVAVDPAVVRELTITEWVLAYSTGVTAGHSVDDMVDAGLAVGAGDDPDADDRHADGLRVLLAAATRVWAFPVRAGAAERVRAALDAGAAGEGPLERVLRSVGRVLLEPAAVPARERAALADVVPALAAVHPVVLPAAAFAAEAAQDLRTAAAAWDTGVRAFHEGGSVGEECLALAGRAGSLIGAGRPADGLADAQVGIRTATALELPLLAGLAAAGAARAHAWLGSRDEGEEVVRWARELVRDEPPCRLGRARGAWAVGLLALADDRPAEALAPLHRVAVHATTAHWALADLVEAAVAAGDTTGVAARVAPTARAAEVLGSDHLRCLVHRARALLVTDPVSAERHHRAAVAAGRASGAPLELGRALLAHARWLAGRGRGGEAAQRAGAAAELFRAAGALPWAERAQALA